MCYDDGVLQAFLDGELPDEMSGRVKKHVKSCARCREVMRSLDEASCLSESALSSLERDALKGPRGCAQGAGTKFDPNEGFSRFLERLGAHKREEYGNENRRPSALRRAGRWMARNARVVVAAGMILCIGGVLGIAPVRTAASQILGVLRVQRIAVVDISPDEIRHLERVLRDRGGLVNVNNFGQVEVRRGEPYRGIDTRTASRLAGFELKLPSRVPSFYAPPEVAVNESITVDLTLDVDRVNQMLTSLGARKLVPREADGKRMTIRIPPTVSVRYEAANDDHTVLTILETRSPELVVPAGVDPNSVRDAILSLPFVPNELKSRLLAIGDWQHTLVIPNVRGSSRRVSVDDREGVFIQPEREGGHGALIWFDGEIICGIFGKIGLDGALEIASSMRVQ